MWKLVVQSILVVVLALGACGQPGSEPAGSGGEPSTSYDGTWQLVEGRGPDGDIPLIDGYRITLDIDGEVLGGIAACNNYYGTGAVIDGASFRLKGASINEMGCRPDVHESESAYMTALMAARDIERNGDALTLTGSATELRFELTPPVPTADLVGTRWELESLIYGSGDDGAASSAQPAYLLLHDDGTLEGTTGCRALSGKWRETGDVILFTTFGAEGNCPEELREQDGHVVGALGDGFRPEIEGDRLTIVGRFQQGLEYRAAD